MSFLFTPELEQLQESLRGFFSQQFPAEKRRTFLAANRTPEIIENLRARWKRFADLGALYGGVPEESGGLGLGFLSDVVVVREAAKVLAPLPILETIVFGTLPIAKAAPAQLANLLSGEEIATGMTDANTVPEARLATAVVTIAGSGEVLISRLAPAENLAIQSSAHGAELMREEFPAAEVKCASGVVFGSLSPDQLTLLRLERLVLLAAEMSGSARTVEAMTHAHVLTRKQFDTPIGGFQAVQHKLADCRVALDAGDALIHFAGWTRDHDPVQFGPAALAAYAFVGSRTREVIESCLQAHGGIGFTYEYDLHLFLRRTLAVSSWFGSVGTAASALAGFHLQQ